jgi:hypothetical protein
MLRKLIITSAIVAAASGYAFAQSAPSTANTTGPDVTKTQNSPTDLGTASESGNTKSVPGGKNAEHGGMTASKKHSGSMTTGSGVANPRSETMKKDASPASGAEGANKEK